MFEKIKIVAVRPNGGGVEAMSEHGHPQTQQYQFTYSASTRGCSYIKFIDQSTKLSATMDKFQAFGKNLR